MWAGTVLAVPPRLVLTDSRAWIGLGAHTGSSAEPPRFITTELGGFHAVFLWVLLSWSVTLHSAGRRLSRVFWDRGIAGIPRHCLAVQEYGAEPRQ